MASNQQGNSEVSTKGKAKNDLKKRVWSSAEEEVLLTGLKGLVADGWKTDNGFKGGYMNVLEDALRLAFPNTDLRGKPHVDSKLTAWKRTYSMLRDILARSGVGFNVHGDHKIDCEDAVWEEISRSNSKIQNWHRKKWDYYEAWKIVFGKDRANGEGADDFIDMVNNLMQGNEEPSHVRGSREDSPINLDEPPAPKPAIPIVEDSVGNSTYSSSKPSKTGKKRAFDESISTLVDIVDSIQQTNLAKYEVISSAFGRQGEVNKSRDFVWPLLKKVPGLTQQEMFWVCEKLLKSPECLQLFMGLEEEARPAYIEYLKST